MKYLLRGKYIIFFFAVFSLIPLAWAPLGTIIAGGDDNYLLNPAFFFHFSAWDNSGYYLNLNSFFSRIFPFGFLWWSLQKLSFNSALVEKVWLWSMWFIGCVSIYYLAKVFFPKDYKIIGIFSAIFYFLNPFTTFIPLTITLIYPHTFLPLLLAFFVKGIMGKSDKERLFYAILFGLAALLAAPTFASPPNALAFMLMPLFYFLFSIYKEGLANISQKIIFSIEALISLVLFNLYHIWSTVYIWFFGGSENIVTSLGNQLFKTSSLFDVFRTLGGWAFGLHPLKSYEAMFYDNFGIVFFSYLLVIITFSSILYINKNKNVLFLFLSAIVLLFLVKGTLAPFGGIYQSLFDNFNFFKGFREPWTKFSPPYVMSLSLLFGYSCWRLIDLANIRNRIWSGAAILIILAALLCVGFPALNGANIFDLDLPGQRSTKIKIPQYWNDFVAWTEKNNGAVLITPRNLSARDYKWKSGISSLTPLEYLFIRNPIRYSNYLANYGIPDYDGFFYFFGDVNKIKSDNFYNFLKMLGIKYVVQENDVFWELKGSGIYSPEVMKEALSGSDFLEKTNTFGKIDVYQLKGNISDPIVYPSQKIILSNGPAYAFSSWNKKEETNFSFIEKKDLNFDTSHLNVARQVFSKNIEEGGIDAPKIINLDVDKGGDYAAYLRLQDDGKADRISLDGGFNENSLQSQTTVIDRNPIFKNNLDFTGYSQIFNDVSLGSVALEPGKNTYDIKSKDIAKNNFSYLVLNQYFEKDEKDSNIPEIEIKNSSDTKYLLDIKNNGSPYILNLAVNFDKNWELYLIKNKNTLLNAPHFKINGGTGNGWYIDPKNFDSGDYELSIEYKPQKYLNFFLLVSLASLIVGFIIIFRLRYIFYE